MRYVKDQIEESIKVKDLILNNDEIIRSIDQVVQLIVDAYRRGHKVLLAGNGGSAADAQHLAGELVSRLNFDRPGLAAIALTTDTSVITAIGNDYGYQQLFSRQIQGIGVEGDVLIAISTSGNSLNIISALKASKEKGITTIGLTGISGGGMVEYCNVCIKVPSAITPRIQEAHIMIGHIICSQVEAVMFSAMHKGAIIHES